MSDYIPDTEEVSNMYSSPSWVTLAEETERYEEFERWLNSVKADAWDKGSETGYEEGQRALDFESGFSYRLPNPYRKEQHDDQD